MNQRKYLPTLSELIDRLSIAQLKEVFISEHKDEYSKEISEIIHDIQIILDETNGNINAETIRAIVVLSQMNLHIWHNESNYRKGIKVGVWEKIKYETQGNLGWHLYTHHVNNLIVEERRYYIKNGMEILHDYYVYKYIQSDTLRVHRSFDITTGYMVQLDTLKNSVVEGIFKLWSDKDGTLYREFCVRDNILIYEYE